MEPEIATAPKRARLAARKNPYWVGLSGRRGGVSLGYRKGVRGPGAWVAKVVIEGTRIEGRIGVADDQATPGSLSYRIAVSDALEWSRQQHASIEARGASPAVPRELTVRTAVEAYSAARAKKSKASGKISKGRLAGYVLTDKAFADTKLAKLRASTIEAWRERLPVKSEEDPEAKGLAPSSINRLLNDLRAALNAAAERHRRELPAYVAAEIRVGTRRLSVESGATMMLLSDGQVRSVIDRAAALDENFGWLVMAAAATGARFSQLVSLKVEDLQPRLGRLMIPSSKKGRAAKARPPVAYPLGADVIEALQLCAAGRDPRAPLFRRWSYKRGGRLKWVKDKLVAWAAAYEVQSLWGVVATNAELPAGTTMYALRHSSIVRALSAGVPVRLVAALHDTSVAMIEKHYSAFIVETTEELARRGGLALS